MFVGVVVFFKGFAIEYFIKEWGVGSEIDKKVDLD